MPTTVNPIGFDLEAPAFFQAGPSFAGGQARILRALRRMGARLTLSCTPYYLPEVRGLPAGSHVAWGESNAVVYANTVLGLRTNREGGPLAVMAAVTGRTYYYGLHLDENREPSRAYVYTGRLDEARAGMLGEIIALTHRDERPPLVALASKPREVALREMLAALGAAGSIGMAVIPGVTPGAPRDPGRLERVEVEEQDVEARLAELSPGAVDVVYLGCPHYGLEDLERLASRLERLGRARIPVLVSASRLAVAAAARSGLLARLARLGVKVSGDTCMIVSPLSVKGARIGTNSYKAYFYLERRGARVGLAPEEELLEAASRGW
ncbi:aconitase X [Stetteria hydrogenophila]